MVATTGIQGGRRWHLAPCLIGLANETDFYFPGRSKVADGSIGDAAHAARDSDHNPGDDAVVTALDITDDDDGDIKCDTWPLVMHLVTTRDDRVKYIIHEGWIWKSYRDPRTGAPAWTKLVYTGPNAHTGHAHVSVLDEMIYATGPWWPVKSKPKPVSQPTKRIEGDMDIIIVEETKNIYAIMPDGAQKLNEEEFWDMAGSGATVHNLKQTTAETLFHGKRTYSFNH